MGILHSSFAPHRRVRHDGWTLRKRVTFCVTLAASGSVTFAAESAGLSRKSAYALRKRDPGFASLWDSALGATQERRLNARRKARGRRAEGNKVEEVEDPPKSISQGDSAALARTRLGAAERDLFFARLEMRLPAGFSRRASRSRNDPSCQQPKTVGR